ncbi:MAG: SDR family oxidoreductase, partial [Armatimonadetes bacterium]|nr:SDR family oxidoreductase [Armatimonadota bacterium]
MPSRLAGKVAVVTGSTSGIGECIARTFAAEGAAVVISGRRAAEGEAIARSIVEAGGEAVYQRTDLRDPDNCRRLIDRAAEAFGGLDILVNNAGIFPRRPLLEVDAEFWDAMLETNLRGPFFCCQAAIPRMRERGGGVILSMGSGNAFLTGETLLPYGVSKGALYNLTMNLARMLARDRIRVNWVTVGWVLTEKEYETQLLEGRDREAMAEMARNLPMGEFTTVEDMAAACVFLASDEARHVTGCDLNVTAGMR